MADINLNKEEKKRLEKIDASLGWRFPVSIKEHFNKTGKLEAFAKAPTEEEKRAQMQCGMELFGKNSDLASVKAMDIFLSVARRIGDDKELAALLPKNKFDAKDAELLEKLEMKSLATLIKLQL